MKILNPSQTRSRDPRFMDVPLGVFPKNGGPRDTLWTPGKFLVLSYRPGTPRITWGEQTSLITGSTGLSFLGRA